MTTEQREWTRLLAWEGCLNARDLGGYETADGRETRWGTVVRSDSPAALTEAGRAALADYGVRAIVDLRLPGELADDPNPFAEPGDHGIAYTNVSFIDPAAAPPDAVSTLAEDYLGMLDRYRQGVAEAMAAIAGAPEGAVLIHCAAGKDRTGLISALLLGLVDVPGRDDRRRLRHDGRAAAAPGAGVAGALLPRGAGRARGHGGQVRPHRRGHAEGAGGAGRALRRGRAVPPVDGRWARTTWSGCATGWSPRPGGRVDKHADGPAPCQVWKDTG